MRAIEIENQSYENNSNPESAREQLSVMFTKILEPLTDYSKDTIDSNDQLEFTKIRSRKPASVPRVNLSKVIKPDKDIGFKLHIIPFNELEDSEQS